jgi:FAS-associated factor 2
MSSQDQNDKVRELCSILGLSNDSQARQLLQSTGWDLQQATMLGLAAGPSHAHVPPPTAVAAAAPLPAADTVMQNAAPPSVSQTTTFFSPDGKVTTTTTVSSTAGPGAASSTTSTTSTTANTGLLGMIPGGGMLRSFLTTITTPLYGTLDPQGDMQRFIENFEAKHEYHPSFFRGSYIDAVRHAASMKRLLFVYLHCDDHEDTETFERETVCTESITNFLNENFVTWIGNVKHPDAHRLSAKLQCESYPFFAVFASSGSTIKLLARHSGIVDTDSLIVQLMGYIESHATTAARTEHKQVQQTVSRSLREEQDMEYQRVLEQDREAKRQAVAQKQAEEDAKQQAIADAERQQQEEQARIAEEKRVMQERKARWEALPTEPQPGAGVVNVLFRLPHGKKLTRCFHETQLMQVLFDFLDSHEDTEQILESGKYELVMNYPRRVFSDTEVDLKTAGIHNNSALFVNSLNDAESSSEAESSDEDLTDEDE